MQSVDIVDVRAGSLLRERLHIKRPCCGVDHWRFCDSRSGTDALGIASRNRRYTAAKETRRPIRCRNINVGVERINRVVFGDHIKHVVHAFAGNRYVRRYQRLRKYVTVHVVTEQLSEVVHVDVQWRQLNLVGVDALPGVVVTKSQNRLEGRRAQWRGKTLRRMCPRRTGGICCPRRVIVGRVGRKVSHRITEYRGLRSQGHAVRPCGRVGSAVVRPIENRHRGSLVSGGNNLAQKRRAGGWDVVCRQIDQGWRRKHRRLD